MADFWQANDQGDLDDILVDALHSLSAFLDSYRDVSVEVWMIDETVCLNCYETSYGKRLMFAAMGASLEEAYIRLNLHFIEYYKSLSENPSE